MRLPPQTPRESSGWQLAEESIAVKIRWFGLGVGYFLVNFGGGMTMPEQAYENAILTLGAVYAIVDTVWSIRGRVFLGNLPLVISVMETVFIGLLCYFHSGVSSPFGLYYLLSLLVCAMRHPPNVTLATLLLHLASYSTVMLSQTQSNTLTPSLLMLVMMGWVTWASTSLAGLLKGASKKLTDANRALQENQRLLEQRIHERTGELQQSQALVVQQEKQAAFGLLAAGIAHEVGNPLAAISSLVQLLKRHHADNYTSERLQMVDDQLRRIQRTLRELVDFSRPASSKASLCNIHEVVDAALNIAKYYKRTKGKQLVTQYQADLPAIRVVRDQLVQVFLNLVLNAMDATEEGDKIEIRTSLDGDFIRVDVQDTGCGISIEDQARVFLPYFTTKATGTGLGLFVCRQIIQAACRGRIELVKSSPAGTTFAVYVACDRVLRDAALEAQRDAGLASQRATGRDSEINSQRAAAPMDAAPMDAAPMPVDLDAAPATVPVNNRGEEFQAVADAVDTTCDNPRSAAKTVQSD